MCLWQPGSGPPRLWGWPKSSVLFCSTNGWLPIIYSGKSLTLISGVLDIICGFIFVCYLATQAAKLTPPVTHILAQDKCPSMIDHLSPRESSSMQLCEGKHALHTCTSRALPVGRSVVRIIGSNALHANLIQECIGCANTHTHTFAHARIPVRSSHALTSFHQKLRSLCLSIVRRR